MAQPLRTKYPFGFHRANASLLLVAGPPHFQGGLGAQPGEVSFHFSEGLGRLNGQSTILEITLDF